MINIIFDINPICLKEERKNPLLITMLPICLLIIVVILFKIVIIVFSSNIILNFEISWISPNFQCGFEMGYIMCKLVLERNVNLNCT